MDKHQFSSSRTLNSHQIAYYFARWRLHNIYCPKSKLVFGFTPKAGCSTASKIFFLNTPGHSSDDYMTWPHKYRQAYQQQHPTTLGALLSPSIRKIKFVRNPFSRAVSSYTHAIRTQLSSTIEASGFIDDVQKLSFSDYLTWLEGIRLSFANPHFGHQKIVMETSVLRYDHIIRIESIAADLEAINRHFGLNLSVPERASKSRHHLSRDASKVGFCGATPYRELGISKSGEGAPPYASFYDGVLQRRVAKLFAPDFKAYGYSPTSLATIK